MVDSDGSQLGVIPTSQALGLAQQKGMDLVEVAPNATPPVCRIVDFRKYKYEQEKREREARKHQHANKLKEIKMRLNIDQHDYETKLKHMVGVLEEGMQIKGSLYFRGRENAHPEYGQQLMVRVLNDLEGAGRAEVTPRVIGRSVQMMVGPARGGVKKPKFLEQKEQQEQPPLPTA